MAKEHSEMHAVLLAPDGTVYGAASGAPFQTLDSAKRVVDEVPEAAEFTAASIRPHDLEAVDHEAHDLSAATSIPGPRHREVLDGVPEPAASGAVDGTLYDPDAASLQAVLVDEDEGQVFGTAEGLAFGEHARAQDVVGANSADHLRVATVRPFDELIGG